MPDVQEFRSLHIVNTPSRMVDFEARFEDEDLCRKL